MIPTTLRDGAMFVVAVAINPAAFLERFNRIFCPGSRSEDIVLGQFPFTDAFLHRGDLGVVCA